MKINLMKCFIGTNILKLIQIKVSRKCKENFLLKQFQNNYLQNGIKYMLAIYFLVHNMINYESLLSENLPLQ